MSKPTLVRGLHFPQTMALVIGTIIGTGVFLKAAPMAQATDSPILVLWVWIVAGALSLAGALTYAELGALLPQAGGEYIYLRAAYGDLAAFLFGWMRIAIGATGSIAVAGVAAATFSSALFPLDVTWIRKTFFVFGHAIHWEFGLKQIVAVAVIGGCSALNCARVAFGGRVQLFITILKILSIVGLFVGIFLFGRQNSWTHLTYSGVSTASHGISAFGAALIAALWAFDGWNNMPMVAGEVHDPGRNIPRALFLGMLVVLFLYGALNLSYFYALPFDEILTSNSTAHRDALPVAAKAARTFLGAQGPQLISVVFLVSTLGLLNGSILTNARIPYAMARDGLFFSSFARLNDKSRVPVTAILIQSAWACVLAVSATFDQLTDTVVFAGWIFYLLTTAAVFVLRRKMPDAERPYKTFGYPYVPLVFIIAAAALLLNTLVTSPVESLFGLVLILGGLPIFLGLKRAGVRRDDGGG